MRMGGWVISSVKPGMHVSGLVAFIGAIEKVEAPVM